MNELNKYNELRLELQNQQNLYLQYATGLKCFKLENIQKANAARNQCKVIKSKLNKLENNI